MTSTIDNLLLLALPASGKSEIRRYLAWLEQQGRAGELGLGPLVQLDDYPYVHFMRRIDTELRRLGAESVFYPANDQPLIDGRDWATLIELINEDHAALGAPSAVPDAPTRWLCERFDRARRRAGLPSSFEVMPDRLAAPLAAALDEEVTTLAVERADNLGKYRDGVSTVVIEFARGGPAGSELPLLAPYGYRFSLSVLADQLVKRAGALYVWVEPAESRRRNRARTIPGPDGEASILHHGVPEVVMHADYGTDDFRWLLAQGRGTTLPVDRDDQVISVPAAVFDNRIDHTSFLRADETQWAPERIAALHAALAEAFARLQ